MLKILTIYLRRGFGKPEIDLKEFSENLRHLSALEKLLISLEKCFTDTSHMCYAIEGLKYMEILDLYLNDSIKETDFISFCKSLASLTKILELKLMIVPSLTDLIVAKFSQAIESLGKLKKLSIVIYGHDCERKTELIPISLSRLENFSSLQYSFYFSSSQTQLEKFNRNLGLLTNIKELDMSLKKYSGFIDFSHSICFLNKLTNLILDIEQDLSLDTNTQALEKICKKIKDFKYLSQFKLMISSETITEFVGTTVFSSIEGLSNIEDLRIKFYGRSSSIWNEKPLKNFLQASSLMKKLISFNLSFYKIGLDENSLDSLHLAVGNLSELKSIWITISENPFLRDSVVEKLFRAIASIGSIESTDIYLSGSGELSANLYHVFENCFKAKTNFKFVSFNLRVKELKIEDLHRKK